MPGKRRGGANLGRGKRSGKQKNSTTAQLHAQSSSQISARARARDLAGERTTTNTNNDYEDDTFRQQPSKDERVPNLKREIATKQKNIEELKSDKADAWEAHRQSEAKVEKIIAVFTERVRTAEKEAEQANVRAEVANNNVEAVREYWKGHAAATEKKCEAEVEAVKKQADAYRYTADTMVATVKKQCNAEVDAARSREAAAKENYKGEVDATKIKAREKVMEHKKRTAAVLDDVKMTAKEKRTQLTMKQKEAAEKKDMKSAERLKELKERLLEEKKSTELQRKTAEKLAVEDRRHFQAALKAEREFYQSKVNEKKEAPL